MTNKIFTISVIVTILLTACQSSNDRKETTEQPETKDAVSQSHQHHEQEATVSLNNGAKWEANPETTEGIHKMQKLVDDHLAGTDKGDVAGLTGNLEKEFSGILEKCTMKGEAHEQLHNYLLPLKSKIEELKAHPETAKIKAVQSYLLEYENYFQ